MLVRAGMVMGKKNKNKIFRKASDSIFLDISLNKKDNIVEFDVVINGEKVEFYSDFIAFILFSKHSYLTHVSGIYSRFEPFSCSCGNSGCASIWDGIDSKHRKNTVEWRIPKGCGYQFLDKSFYQFSTLQYEQEILKVWKWVNAHREAEHECNFLGENLDYWNSDEYFIPALLYLNSL
jgi:hypothetical protein